MSYLEEDNHEDALQYASALTVLVRMAMVLLCVSYLVYIFMEGALQIPADKIASLWSLSSSEMKIEMQKLSLTGGTGFWDALPLWSVMVLSSISCVTIALLLRLYLKQKLHIRAALAFAQLVILALAMSGTANHIF